MALEFTKFQQAAIEREGNILVSAAAGSGKTAVLVERVIRKLTNPKNPVSADRLLIVTFTNAAAEEMRSRIERRLNDECVAHPENVKLLKQKHLLSCADICTIDSFCINFVRENFHACDVEPDFKVGDDSVYESEMMQILSDMITTALAENDEGVLGLLSLLNCEKSAGPLLNLISDIYKYSLNMPFADEFLDNLILPFTDDFCNDSIFCKEIMNLAKIRCASLNKYSQRLKEDAYIIEKEKGHIEYANIYAKEVAYLTQAALSDDYDTLYNAVKTYKNFRGAVKAPSKPQRDDTAIKFARDMAAIKENDAKLFEIMLYDRQAVIKYNNYLLPFAKKLVALVKEYSDRVKELYSENNFLSFAATERLVFSMLCSKQDARVVINDTAREYLSRYDEVLVDEFQDVNDLQNMLFYALSRGEENLFVVGDVKQSIYRFRGSNPKNFTEKKNRYVYYENASLGEPQKIILADNFRSRKGVCEYVNFFFSLIMNTGVGGVDYSEEDRLNAGLEFPEASEPEVEIVIADKSVADPDEAAAKAAQYEAKCIADRIISVMNSGFTVTDKETKENRAARFCDFAILMPALKNKAQITVKTLRDYGIPVSLSSESYTETFEISVMLALLQVIDNPLSDIDMLTVMLSPIYDFSADETALIRAKYREESIYASVCLAAGEGDLKAKAFVGSLNALRYDSRILQLNRFIGKIMHQTGFIDTVSAMDFGTERRNNMFKLSSFANDYTANGGKTLTGFVKYVRGLPQSAFEDKGISNGNTVKLMTIHHSKGLQFKICIVAGISSRPNLSDSSGAVLYNEKYGLGVKSYDYSLGDDIVSASYRVISEYEKQSTIAEKIRLFYVALTRAEEKLIIITSFNDAQKAVENLNAAAFDDNGNIDYTWLCNEMYLSNWVMATCLKNPNCHEIRGMCEDPVLPNDCGCEAKIITVNGFENLNVSGVKEETPDADEELLKEIKENTRYVYPYQALGSLRAKESVSGLAEGKANERFYFTDKPDFMLESGVSASGRGTAVHRVMQFIKFTEKVDVKAEIDRLVEWHFITEKQASAADCGQIERFFESNLYKRILSSRDVRREMRFLSEIPACRIEPNIEAHLKDTPVVIQGAVDLCFEEDEGIVVVDFKTDRVDNKEQLLELYGAQLNIYSDACEKIFNKPVKERIIYSFALSKEISL